MKGEVEYIIQLYLPPKELALRNLRVFSFCFTNYLYLKGANGNV